MAVLIPRREPVNSQDEKFFKALGNRIAQARKARGFTQQQIAEHLGIVQQTYAHYEVGHVRFPASMLPILGEILDLSSDELLGREGQGRARKAKPGPVSKLDQQFERIQQFPRTKQRIVMEMLDAFIAQASQEARHA